MKYVLAVLALVYASTSFACLRKSPDPMPERPGLAELYKSIQSQFAQIEATKNHATKGKLVYGLANILPDDSDYTFEGCSTEMMNFIAQDILDASGKIRQDVGTYMELKALQLGNLFVPYDTKFAIAKKVFEAKPEDFVEGDWDGSMMSPDKDSFKGLAAKILTNSNFFINVEGYLPFIINELKTQTDEELFLNYTDEIKNLLETAEHPLGVYTKEMGQEVARDLLVHLQAAMQKNATNIYPYEVVTKNLSVLAEHAKTLGLEAEVKALLQGLVDAKGVAPVSENMYEGPQRLLREAQIALLYL